MNPDFGQTIFKSPLSFLVLFGVVVATDASFRPADRTAPQCCE